MKFVLGLVLVTSCGVDVPPSQNLGSDDPGAPMAPTATPLISGAWSLQPDSENYVCVRQTVTTDTFIKTIVPIAPLGTHHFVLMVGDPDGPDGVTNCDSSLTKPAIFASGVGVQPLSMPDGIAIHLKAGQQLLLNLHLFNAGDDPLSGTSGISIEPSEPVDDAHSAGVVLVGKTLGLTVAVGESTQDATCTTPAGMTMFAIAPHMHLLGTHIDATYNGTTLYDSDYVFDEQQFRMIPPTLTTAQGKYHVTCSYTNYTGSVVKFGESTKDEMCFAITFAYPAPTQKTCGI
jgi:Copper type II ascorbate-dependent monooxygenase, C-terminal domain